MKTTKMPGSLKLKYSAGTDSSGKEIFKTRIFGNINPDATDVSVYALKSLLAAVQTEATVVFVRTENKAISEE